MGYLDSYNKEQCFGCEACVQICPKQAIEIREDEEGFRYPVVDDKKCVNCNLCKKVCPHDNMPERFSDDKFVFGGYHKDKNVRKESTSGGAFSAILSGWCDENYVIFGAVAKGLLVYHDYVTDIKEADKFRKSKYSQSKIGNAYSDVENFLKQGKKVLFSGTPCQNAALKSYLNCHNVNTEKLLLIDVVCEGVPTPLYIRKYDEYMKKKYGYEIEKLEYRYKKATPKKNPVRGKWDFEVMYTQLTNGRKIIKDRWVNPFWSIWLNHIMSRPSCYKCSFTTRERVADITLGDLWGVHIYCPELYGMNMGSSLIICNTQKGKDALALSEGLLYGHSLDFETALKYQGPMRRTIEYNPKREEFMQDVKVMDYKKLCKKWAIKPTAGLLFSKYVYGNRQKVFLWNVKNCLKRKK